MDKKALAALLATIGDIPDKKLYHTLEINSGQWSKICSGEANFPLDKLPRLFEECKNTHLLHWLAGECGYELVLKRSAAEQQRDDAVSENKVLKRLIKELTKENN